MKVLSQVKIISNQIGDVLEPLIPDSRLGRERECSLPYPFRSLGTRLGCVVDEVQEETGFHSLYSLLLSQLLGFLTRSHSLIRTTSNTLLFYSKC